MKIDNIEIGFGKPIFLIAEAGVNYNNKLNLAFKMIDHAKKIGINAIKFQTWKTDKIQFKNSKKPLYQKNIKKRNYFELLKSLEPSQKDQEKIFDYCKKKKILFLSTPYDDESVKFLDGLGVHAFKISSSDLSNHLLLKQVVKTKKPIILSTGLSTLAEIDETVKFLLKNKIKNKLALLQTTSSYPTDYSNVNLRVISTYRSRYNFPIGLSDHTKDEIASLGAIGLGACILEKHFTLNKKYFGPDQSSSLNPTELKNWVTKIRILEKELGTNKKIITNVEKNNLSMKKVLVIFPQKKNSKITENHIKAMRTNGIGINPTSKNLEKIIGKKLKKEITKPINFSWNFI